MCAHQARGRGQVALASTDDVSAVVKELVRPDWWPGALKQGCETNEHARMT
jgi:hypothetical protein